MSHTKKNSSKFPDRSSNANGNRAVYSVCDTMQYTVTRYLLLNRLDGISSPTLWMILFSKPINQGKHHVKHSKHIVVGFAQFGISFLWRIQTMFVWCWKDNIYMMMNNKVLCAGKLYEAKSIFKETHCIEFYSFFFIFQNQLEFVWRACVRYVENKEDLPGFIWHGV